MIQSVKLEFNSEGFREILMSEGVRNLVEEQAQAIASKANANLTDPQSDGFQAEVFQGSMMSKYGHGGRWVGYVRAVDARASADEAENKSLSRAVQ